MWGELRQMWGELRQMWGELRQINKLVFLSEIHILFLLVLIYAYGESFFEEIK